MRFPLSSLTSFALALFMLPPDTVAQDSERARSGDPLTFVIPVLPDARKFVQLLEYPSYLAIAFDTNGFRTSNSGRVIVRDQNTLEFKNSVVRFINRKGGKYFYEAAIEWDLAGSQTAIRVPVEVDTAELDRGSVNVTLRPPLAKYFPQALADKVQLKLTSLAGQSTQARMIDYFATIARRSGSATESGPMLEQILFDAYNLPVAGSGDCVVREPGDAEPLSDQILLIISVLIWIIGPLTLFSFRALRRRRVASR